MDLASLIGLIGAVGMILAAMIAGGGVAPFIDTQSILIVFGGTFFGVMYSNPLPVFWEALELWQKLLCQKLQN